MRSIVAAGFLLASVFGAGAAFAADCPGNPGALGVSRTIVVDPTEHPMLGVHQYRESLPLNDREVVITFDDGPLQPYTTRILDILASECVKATFFMVGRMARGYPHLVKRAYAEGHTLANHSQNHPFTFHKMSVEQATQEIEDGFTSIRAALGDPKGVSNFFRVPGLLRQDSVEHYLAGKGYQTWSVDFMADDWTHISDKEIVRRAISRIEARGKGILLLHDIQPATALGLPELLRELKARGFKIVHVVQATQDRVKTATLPEQWIARQEPPSMWPRVQVASLVMPEPVLETPGLQNFGIADLSASFTALAATGSEPPRASGDIPLPPIAIWPRSMRLVAVSPAEMTPAPAAENFRYTRAWRQRPAVLRTARKPPNHKNATATVTTGSTSAPKGTPANARTTNAPRPPKPTGHQIQLPKQTSGSNGFLQQIGLR
ncbi:MAG: peptidoglycan-N-acetylglucosamine deacetylase [Alphaproteobacteria bacterium]|jgi:peptidoglycan/xylan/chitin deacetylase (PgdA/CDA1 family)|nr:peptidoglycan-N-acetylglucosamine deacetylase [Alphaproteobacteria bacterium]